MRTEYSVIRPGARDWLVVNTHPHKERLAVEHLERQEFRTYCPLIVRQLRKGRRVWDVRRPLFANYLFVQLVEGREQWRPIMSTFGVRRLIRFGECPGLLNDGFVRALRAREVDGVIQRPEQPFKVGESATLSGGPFDGIVVTILEMDDKNRLVVLMNLLGQSVRTKVEAHQLSPLGR